MRMKLPRCQLALELHGSDSGEFLEFVNEVRLVTVSVSQCEAGPRHRAARGYAACGPIEAYQPGICFRPEADMLAKYTFDLSEGEARLVRQRVYPLLTTRSSDAVNDVRSRSVKFPGSAQADERLAKPHQRVIGRRHYALLNFDRARTNDLVEKRDAISDDARRYAKERLDANRKQRRAYDMTPTRAANDKAP